jgi:hypothetical protein
MNAQGNSPSSPVLVLRPTNLHWLNVDAPDPADLCAHSPVELQIGTARLVEPDAGDWTASAAALYLLRTLTRPHTKTAPVGDHLFPCCGFTMYDLPDEDDVVILGCMSGVDLEVTHSGDHVIVTAPDGGQHEVPFATWKSAVCGFSGAVRAFYDQSPPRRPADGEDEKGFRKFMAEWDRRLIACADE